VGSSGDLTGCGELPMEIFEIYAGEVRAPSIKPAPKRAKLEGKRHTSKFSVQRVLDLIKRTIKEPLIWRGGEGRVFGNLGTDPTNGNLSKG